MECGGDGVCDGVVMECGGDGVWWWMECGWSVMVMECGVWW